MLVILTLEPRVRLESVTRADHADDDVAWVSTGGQPLLENEGSFEACRSAAAENRFDASFAVRR